jgi:flagellar assembly factor FliW
LSDEDRKSLKLDGQLKTAKLFAIVTIPTDPTKMTANLKAPIIINLKHRLAKQVILHEQDYPIRQGIFTELQHHCAATHTQIFPDNDAPTYQAIHISEELDLGATRDLT